MTHGLGIMPVMEILKKKGVESPQWIRRSYFRKEKQLCLQVIYTEALYLQIKILFSFFTNCETLKTACLLYAYQS